jgi:hypothetical protein
MSAECRQLTGIITEYLASESGAAEMQALMERRASAGEIVDALAEACRPAEAALMREEFAELPENFVQTFTTAWAVAASGGRAFTLTSAPPAQPLAFARRGCVAYTIEHDDRGITMYVSHVHGRHAEWYKPAMAIA